MNETLVSSVEECSLQKQCGTDTIMMTCYLWHNLHLLYMYYGSLLVQCKDMYLHVHI